MKIRGWPWLNWMKRIMINLISFKFLRGARDIDDDIELLAETYEIVERPYGHFEYRNARTGNLVPTRVAEIPF